MSAKSIDNASQGRKTDTSSDEKSWKPLTEKDVPKVEHPLASWSNDTVPPPDRSVKLVRKNSQAEALAYKLWLGGWVSCIVFGTLSILMIILRYNRWYIGSIVYRIALLGAVVSTSLTTWRRFGSNLPPMGLLLASENFQFVINAFMWFFTFRSMFKVLPYILLGVLHIANQFNIKPILAQRAILSSLIAYDELVLMGYLLLRTLLFQHTSGYQLTVYFAFYWLRILFNNQTKAVFATLVKKVDWRVKDIKNPQFQKVWKKFKIYVSSKEALPTA
ncbi:hypothetical protein DICA1_B12398 [Diutina catenulata]